MSCKLANFFFNGKIKGNDLSTFVFSECINTAFSLNNRQRRFIMFVFLLRTQHTGEKCAQYAAENYDEDPRRNNL